MSVSERMPPSSRKVPAKEIRSARWLINARYASSLGTISSPIGAANTHAASTGSCCGQVGNNELLQAAEEAACIDDYRLGLNQRGLGIGFHCVDQTDDRVACHQTIGVENNHVIIRRSEPSDPLCNVAGFPGGVIGSMSIIEPMGTAGAAQCNEGRLFADPDVRVGRVAQQEPIESGLTPRRRDRFIIARSRAMR